MRIVALDASLTSTGFAVGSTEDPDAWKWQPGHLGTWDPEGRKGMERLTYLRSLLIDLTHNADLVVVEDYAYSRAQWAHQIGELGGMIRLTLTDLGIPWVAVGTGQLKKYATGKGNASKEKVLVEAVKRLEYNGASNDEADVLWLLEMALDHYGIVESVVPKSHREKLEEPDWPALPHRDT